MLQTYQTLRIFISSPGDVAIERKLAQEIIQRINEICKKSLAIALEVDKWENLLPQTPNLSEQQVQDVINDQLQKCNVFILVLYKRYGSVQPGYKKSNTEREIEIALDLLRSKKEIVFLSYFRNIPENRDVGKQEKKVKKLRDDLRKKGIFSRGYFDPKKFKDLLTHDLYETVLRYRVSALKRRYLQAFWQVGINERDNHPKLAIIYPPVGRAYMRQEDPDKFWLSRLVPHVVFEDFKALQKLEKGLRLIGFNDFKFFSSNSVSPSIYNINRVWICVPRNPRAKQQLNNYQDISKFKFEVEKNNFKARLFWRRTPKSKWFEVQSPLAIYLRLQRKHSPGGEWNQQLGKIIAKDFAIIGRFKDYKNEGITTEGTLKDYFIAGIRGLGTWGAGWFIDRKYRAFKDLQDSEDDIQVLLEVIYRDETIVDVRDVSNESPNYFRRQNDPGEIRKIIAEYQRSTS